MNERTLKLELHKVRNEIKRHGTSYNFYRDIKDEYNEPTEQPAEFVATVCGLFHVSKGFITLNISDSGNVRTKGQPMMMVEYENQTNIRKGDFVIINGNKYKVVDKNNIQEYNIVIDISLELVLDGNN